MLTRLLFSSAIIATTSLSAFAGVDFPHKTPTSPDGPTAEERLMIVNGNTGRVVYDDGYDDLICVTRRIIIGYNDYGRPIIRRTMHCR